jgi:hypothetical protein
MEQINSNVYRRLKMCGVVLKPFRFTKSKATELVEFMYNLQQIDVHCKWKI